MDPWEQISMKFESKYGDFHPRCIWKYRLQNDSHFVLCSVLIIIANLFKWHLDENKAIFIQESILENVVCKMAAILSRPQSVKTGSSAMSGACLHCV